MARASYFSLGHPALINVYNSSEEEDGRDLADHRGFHEAYNGSLMILGEKLDSAQIAEWLKD